MLLTFLMASLPPTATSFTPVYPADESIDKLSKWKNRWDDNMIGKILYLMLFYNPEL